jgi:uncharacterized protein (DUF2249 family)/quercetin dioxygenase-like cupin family protein
MPHDELDVRQVPKPERHPLIFERFAHLGEGETFTVVTNHEPTHLRDEFERDQPELFTWKYVETGPRTWRVKIGRSSFEVPRLLGNAQALTDDDTGPAAGATWKLEVPVRQLDANVIRLAPGGQIDMHRGPDLDVLVLVVAGSGSLVSRAGVVPLLPGHLVWLPRRSDRSFVAGSDGVSYFTVHQRRPLLRLSESQPVGLTT